MTVVRPDPRAEPALAAAELPALIDGCRRGERGALERVFRAHAARIERLLVRLVGPGPEVEDLLQETFAQAIVAFRRFRGDAAVGTWLHSIAVNVAHGYLRRPRRRRDVPLDEAALAALAAPVPDAADGVSAARLAVHLDKLDAAKRIAIVLHVMEDLPLAEVAALMGASYTATKSRVFWARRALLKQLRKDPAFAERARGGDR